MVEEPGKWIEQFHGMIFDLDGTLLDSMGIWEMIDVAFLERRGIPVPKDYSREMAQRNFTEGADYAIRRFGLSESAEAIIAEWDTMALKAYAETIPLKEGAREFLLYHRERGIPLGVATALKPEYYQPVLKHCGIFDWFSTCTAVHEVSKGKGSPDIYLLAAERMGVLPEETLVFEDIYSGICGAKAGGFSTCGIADPCSVGDWDRMRLEASHAIESFTELLPNFIG